MKVCVFSDIHGSEYFMKKAIEVFEKEEAEGILIVGDVLNHGPRNPFPKDYNPQAVANILNSNKNKIIAEVRGNCDSEVDQMLIDYPIMSTYVVVYINGKKIFMTHGHIYNEDNMPNLEKGDVFLSGHTHIYLATKKNDIYILNPGTTSFDKNKRVDNIEEIGTYGLFDGNYFYVKDFFGKILASIELI